MYKISLSLKSTKISSSKSSIFPKPRQFSFQATQRSKSQISPATFSQIVSKASYSSKIKFNFIEKDGKAIEVEGTVGQNLLDIAHANKVDLEGACEGSLACSTCHVILSPDIYNSLSEPTDEENDMLDLAFGLTQTSRLGCQVLLTKEMEGMNVQLPSATRNMAVDGFKPKPHQ